MSVILWEFEWGSKLVEMMVSFLEKFLYRILCRLRACENTNSPSLGSLFQLLLQHQRLRKGIFYEITETRSIHCSNLLTWVFKLYDYPWRVLYRLILSLIS